MTIGTFLRCRMTAIATLIATATLATTASAQTTLSGFEVPSWGPTPAQLIATGPGGDTCADAIPITDGTHSFDNTGGTIDGEDVFCTPVVSPDVWFNYTATCDGTLVVTRPTNFLVYVYDTFDCPPTVFLGGCTLNPTLQFNVNANDQIKIRVHGWDEATSGGTFEGPGSITVDCQPAPTGACCLSDTCVQLVEFRCEDAGGLYQGDGTACPASGPCLGACCFFDGTCNDTISAATCASSGGRFQGLGTTCAIVCETFPENDECDQRIEITDGSTPYTLENATSDLVVFPCLGGIGEDIWFNYTASCDGVLRVTDTAGNPIDVWSGFDCPPTTFLACGSPIVLPVSAGQQLKIRVGNFASLTGTLIVECLPATGGDDCDDRDLIFDGDTAYSGLDFANSDGPAFDCVGTFLNDLWFNYEATCDGTLTISDSGNNAIDAWAGFDCPPTVPLGCDEGGSLSLSVNAGDEIKIRIGSWSSDVGVLTVDCDPAPIGACCFVESCVNMTPGRCADAGGLYQGDDSRCAADPCPDDQDGACCFFDGSCVEQAAIACALSGGSYQGAGSTCATDPCPPFPDDCDNRIVIADGTHPFDTTGATQDAGPYCFGGTELDVWFNYEATTDGLLSITLDTPDSSIIELFDTGACPPGSILDCTASGGTVSSPVSSGQTVKIRVSAWNSGPDPSPAQGNLIVSCLPYEGADECIDRTEIGEGATLYTLTGSTPSGTTFACRDEVLSDIWFNYTAPCAGTLTIMDSASNVFELWSGFTCPPPGPLLACKDYDDGPVSIDVVANEEIKIRVGPWGSNTGTLTLDLDDTTPPTITFCPPETTVACGASLEPTVFATATDACDPNPTITYTNHVPAGTCDLKFIRTWQARDDSGNIITCDQSVTILAAMGACCLPGTAAGCDVMTQADCEDGLGAYVGDFTECGPVNPCDVGACCLGDGSCEELARFECANQGGEFQGEGIPCTSVKCLGACCLPSGVCADSFVADECVAAGGLYSGVGTVCAEIECLGACCLDVFECLDDLSPTECTDLGGVYQGLGTACGGVDCSNDECTNRTLITDGDTPFSLRFATVDADDPAPPCLNGNSYDGDVWFNYVASCDGLLRVSTDDNGSFVRFIELYDSFVCPPNPSSRLGCAETSGGDGASPQGGGGGGVNAIAVPVVTGQAIKIRIGGWSGTGNLSVSCGASVANDECEDRIDVTDGTTVFDTREASLNLSDPPFGCESQVGGDVWFNYVATCDGAVRIDTCGTEFVTVLEAYRGFDCPPSPADRLACSYRSTELDCPGGDRAGVVIPVTAGDEIKIRVASWDLVEGPGLLNIECSPAVPNDECANRIEITDGLTPFDLRFATTNPDDPVPPCSDEDEYSGDVWFNYVATATGVARFDVLLGDDDFDTFTEVFDGTDCPVDPADRLACEDDELGLLVPVEIGQTIKVRLGGYGSDDAGFGLLRVTCLPAVTNDECDTRVDITECVTPVHTVGATLNPLDPSLCDDPDSGDVWFNYTAPAAGTTSIRFESDDSAIVAVYNADCADLTEIDCQNEGDTIEVEVTAGETLKIRVAGWSGDDPITGDLYVSTGECAPAHDACDSALAIGDGSILFDTTQATFDAADPVMPCGDEEASPDIWYDYTATADGVAIFEVQSFFDALVSVYDGDVCPPTDVLVCENVDDEYYSFALAVTAGQQLKVRIGGYDEDEIGTGVLTVTCGEAVVNDDCEGRLEVFDGVPAIFDTTFATTDPDGATFVCEADAGADVWFNYTPICDGIATIEACSDIDPVLEAYAGIACPPSPEDLLGCADDRGDCNTLVVPVTAGEPIKIRVAGWRDEERGAGTLSVTCGTGTPGDLCETRIVVTEGTTLFDTSDATTLLNDMACLNGEDLGGDVWFNWTASCDGFAQIDTCGSSFETMLEVYDGVETCPPSGETLACSNGWDDPFPCGGSSPGGGGVAGVVIPVTSGQELKIRVGGWNGQTGPGVLNIACLPPEACCFTDGSCQDLPAQQCAADGGFAQGAGTSCGDVDCTNRPTGACCQADGTCVEGETAESCVSGGGVFQGAATTCAGVECAGACCLATGFCADGLSAADCTGMAGTYQGPGSICATVACNDDCENRLLISDGVTPFDATQATPDGPVAPCAPGWSTGDDIWFNYVAPCDGVVQVAFQSNFNSVVEVFDTHDCGSFDANRLGCSYRTSVPINVPVTAGQPLKIRVAAWTGSSGTGAINVSCRLAEENDDCADRLVVEDGVTPFDLTYATLDPDDPTVACSPNTAVGDVWFNYTASCDGTAVIESTGNAVLEAYASFDCPPDESDRLACSSGAPLAIPVTSGDEIKIRVAAWQEATGPGELIIACVDGLDILTNDDCENRIEVVDGTTFFDTSLATQSGIDTCYGGDDVWFNYTATASGEVTIDTCGSSMPPALEVYGGVDCDDLTFLACAANNFDCDDATQASVTIPISQGDRIKIRVSAWSGDGAGQLNVACDPQGACCLPGGTCEPRLESDCLADGGAPQGPNTFCDSMSPGGIVVDCGDPPTGACCTPDGVCDDTGTASECIAAGGVFQGAGMPCNGVALCTGACCLPDDVCNDVAPDDCAADGGVYLGTGTSCGGGNACPPLGSLANDDCDDRAPIGEEPILVDTTFATVDPDDPPFSCGSAGNDAYDVWYNYQATGAGVARITFVPLSLDEPIVEVFDTDTCPPDPLSRLVCRSGLGGGGGQIVGGGAGELISITLQTVADQILKIRVGSWTGDRGLGVLSVECIPYQACCLSDGTCLDVLPDKCIAQGGVPQGAGSLCLGDSNGNGVDDICDTVPCCLVDHCQALPGGSCLDLGGTIVTLTCPPDYSLECTGPGVPTAPLPAVSGSPELPENVCDVTTSYTDEIIANDDPCNPYTWVRTWTNSCVPEYTCVQTIEYVDTTPPTFDPDDVPPNRQADCQLIPEPPLTIPASDACDPSVTELTYDGETILEDPCPEGRTIRRTWSAVDACGNVAVATEIIIIVDTTAPVITGVGPDLTLECVADVPDPGKVTATDNCAPAKSITLVPSATTNKGSGCLGDPLVIVQSWTATDPCGNVATASRTITVEDTAPPSLVGVPPSITIECGPVPPPPTVTAVDNCPGASLAFSETNQPGGCPQNYTITRMWTATDACGQMASASQIITVRDTTAPDIDPAPANVTVECDAIPVASDTIPASDACDATLTEATLGEDITPGGCVGSYTILRTWSATDACGHVAKVTQTITVVDTTPPVVSAPPDITVECDAIPAPPKSVPTEDNCDKGVVAIAGEPQIKEGPCPGAFTMIRSWTATDDCGNVGTDSQTITVIDTTPPVISDVPADATLECGDPPPPAARMLPASDACDEGVKSATLEKPVIVEGDCPGTFTMTRSWTATDGCGNSTTVSQTLTVIDTTPPAPLKGAVPPNRVADCQLVPAAPLTIPAADNCDESVTEFIYDGETSTPGACPQEYTIHRTWSGEDACGNTATVSQTITVVDTAAPTITGLPANVTVSCLDDVPPLGDVSVTDNCAAADDVDLDISETTNKGAGCPGDPLILTRSYTATDPCGNAVTFVRTVTVIDDVAPVLAGVPANTRVSCDAVPPAATVTALDNCSSVGVLLTESTTKGSCPDTYTLTRTWTATDACGNEASASQEITVSDLTPPVVTDCPDGVSVHADAGSCEAVVAWAAPTATDNCDPDPTFAYDIDLDDDGGVDVAGQATATFSFPFGTHRVIAVATDRCGNEDASCSFLVTVSDQSELVVDIALDGTVASPLVRCITFELYNCVSGETETFDELIGFVEGDAFGVSILVPCGEWTCLTARDPLHTLRSTDTDDFAISGSVFVADFTDEDALVGGNTNDSPFIDILDFGLFASQFGQTSMAGACPAVGPDADFNGDGLVNVPDFTFIFANFLAEADAGCCPGIVDGEAVETPVLSIPVDELWTRGLGHLTPADLTGDCVLDAADIAAFLDGARPTHKVGVLRPEREFAEWHDASAWASGAVPDGVTDVYVTHGTIVITRSALVRSVDVVAGTWLTLEDDAWLDANVIVVRAGAVLELAGLRARVSAASIYVEAGAMLIATDEQLQIDEGGRLILEPGVRRTE